MAKRNMLLRKCMAIMLSVALVFTMMPMIPGAVQKVHAEGELLSAPTITIDEDGVATWGAVEGANEYSVMCSTFGGFVDEPSYNLAEELAYYNKEPGVYTLEVYAVDAERNPISDTAFINYTYETDSNHVHSWTSAWSSDATHHWHECTVEGCPLGSDSAKDGYDNHDYFNNVCTSCGKALELKDAPVITIDGSGVATWDAVEGANEYSVMCSTFGGFVDEPSYNLAEELAYYNKEPGVYTLEVYAVDAERNPISETATVKYDTRTVVDTFTATSTIKAPVYGEAVTSVYAFEFTSEVNAWVPGSMGDWYKKNGENWEEYVGPVFTEGTYYYSNQLRLDSTSGTGSTHKVADTLHITINGDVWTQRTESFVFDTYSYAYMKSPEYVVEKTDLELEFIDNASFDIHNVYQNREITPYSVADAVVGGTEPYVFSKTSGPDWIAVAEGGTVSGKPDAIGTNENLVIRVTDSLGAYKEITINVDATLMNPADREIADTFVATSTFKAPAYGDAVTTVYNFNFTSEVNARVPDSMGGWYKKVDGEWVEYTASIFGIGEYFYTNQLRLDSDSGTGSTHQLPKDENISITINGETWTCDSEAWVDDTYSYVYMDSPVYVVKRELPENITLSQESYTYDGTAKTPEITVEDLVKDVDYTVNYSDNINAGTATVTITGIGEYGGTVEKTFTIAPADISGLSIKLSGTSLIYNGKQRSPYPVVKDADGNALVKDTDYDVSYGVATRVNPGRYSVKVTFKGNYSGTKTLYFNILPKAPTTVTAKLYGYDDAQISWSKVTGASGYYVYYKKSTSSKYTLYGRTTGTTSKLPNLADGVYYYFKIVPYVKSGDTRYQSSSYKTAGLYTLKKLSAPVVTKYGTKVKVKWTNINGESGYQISRSTSKTGTNIVATYATTKGTYKYVAATKNKTYYYKVRAYKTVNGKKIYGPWSAVKAYKRK